MDDYELIKQILNGNTNAFTALVSRYQKLVVHIIGRLIQRQEEVEDVSQEVFIKVYENLGKYRAESKLSTWIATIAYNTGVNYLRKFKGTHEINIDKTKELQFMTDNITADYEQIDLHRYIRAQIERLPAHYRTVITLFHLEEFSYQEIEQITGMPEGTVKSYLFRAKALLKEKLEFVTDKKKSKITQKINHEQ
jgi:RNA polymerase sigma factor (sigma-70 family)